MNTGVKNIRLTDQEFEEMRKQVLSSWPTGAEVDIDDAIEFHKSLPPEQNVVRRLQRAKAEGDVLIQPRAGIAPLEACIELLHHLQEDGRADILPTSVDSYTRANRYRDCEEAIRKSEQEGRSYLNGLPVVNYGVKNCRKLVKSLKVPIELRTAAPDSRLSVEIALAAGYSAAVHGPICVTMHYSKNHRLATTIKYYQHVFRLMAEYTRRGVPVAPDIYGLFSNVGVPQSLIYANQIVEALLAAEQGVKYILLNVIMQGNMVQDTANTVVLPVLVDEYLNKFGYRGVELVTVANHWTGPYPEDARSAYALDAVNTVAAVMGNANMIMVKSTDQGVHLPTKEANANALKFTRVMVNYLKNQKTNIGGKDFDLECEMTKRETRELLDKMLEMGEGDPALGAINAYESGMMESPFASNAHYNQGMVMVARDLTGSCRYYDPGKLPLSQQVREWHAEKLQARMKQEKREDEITLIMDSILSLSKEYLV
jgi:methylaspartate mutase epsilon subunit